MWPRGCAGVASPSLLRGALYPRQPLESDTIFVYLVILVILVILFCLSCHSCKYLIFEVVLHLQVVLRFQVFFVLFLGCCFFAIPAALLPAVRLPAARLPAARPPTARLPAARLPAARLPAALLPATLAPRNLPECSNFPQTESQYPNGGLARSILAH